MRLIGRCGACSCLRKRHVTRAKEMRAHTKNRRQNHMNYAENDTNCANGIATNWAQPPNVTQIRKVRLGNLGPNCWRNPPRLATAGGASTCCPGNGSGNLQLSLRTLGRAYRGRAGDPPRNQYGKEMLRPEQHPQMRSGIARAPHILNMGPPMGDMGG